MDVVQARRRAISGWAAAAFVYFFAVFNRASLGVAGIVAEHRFHVGPGALSVFVLLQVGVYAADAGADRRAGRPVRPAPAADPGRDDHGGGAAGLRPRAVVPARPAGPRGARLRGRADLRQRAALHRRALRQAALPGARRRDGDARHRRQRGRDRPADRPAERAGVGRAASSSPPRARPSPASA